MAFNPNWIVGKTIERVTMNPFMWQEPWGEKITAHAPVIHFTDGSSIFFSTEETGAGEYGTEITYVKSEKRRRSK
jgi:hypothetical protein